MELEWFLNLVSLQLFLIMDPKLEPNFILTKHFGPDFLRHLAANLIAGSLIDSSHPVARDFAQLEAGWQLLPSG
jgi:hypothetical protein